MAVRVKICGITRLQDLHLACEAGADALGFVFYEKSPRHVAIERAAELVRVMPPFVQSVGLFVNAGPAFIESVLQVVPLDLLQFHGDEEPAFCASFGVPYIKAVKIGTAAPVAGALGYHALARGLLLDTHDPVAVGGTGRAFDWTLVPAGLAKPVILAGGLNAANVAAAVRLVKPYAVDVSSGVESAPGIKDAAKVREFMRAVAAVNAAARD